VLELLVLVCVPAGVLLPHLLPLERVAPATAAAVWLSALALRALTAIGAALFVFVYLPQTTLFEAVARWCWHEVLPLVAVHLGLSGHTLADLAVVLPGLALAASLLWVLFGLVRAGVALSGELRRRMRGSGPFGSMVVHDRHVLVALTGVGRARVLVSDAALDSLDDQELSASVAHEWGHLHRRHRPVLLLGSMLASLGKGLPGTRRAHAQLSFSLERDADEYAVRSTRDPLALASAICKAASGSVGSPALMGLTGRTGTGLRLEYLLSGGSGRSDAVLERGARVAAGVLITMVLALVITLPLWALAEPSSAQAWGHLSADCPH
jgi:Zn-dependent protease with chaperone function